MSEAQDGILALIRRNGAGLPPTLSPVPLDRVAMEAPIPQPRRNIFCVGKNYHEHAHEFARSGFDSSGAKGAVPGSPIIFSKVPETVVPSGSPVVIDPQSVARGRLRGGTRRHHRQGRPRHPRARTPSIMSGATRSSTT